MAERTLEGTPSKANNECELSQVVSPSPQIKQHGAGNLTGDLRKVKDMAADIYNLISKWGSFNSQGMSILTEMANMMIEKVFDFQDEDGNHRKVIPPELEPMCCSLEKAVESMEYIVEKMAQKVTLAEGLLSLQQYKMVKPTSQVLFSTMTLRDFASSVKSVYEDYKTEVQLKREIHQNVAHSCDRDTTMFYLATWMHQPYIHVETSDLIQAIIKDTGHIK